MRDAQARIGALEAKLLESQSQQLALESLYQELSRSRDDWLLAEVEQTLAIAAQQLQLAGNVQAALSRCRTPTRGSPAPTARSSCRCAGCSRATSSG